MTGFVIQLPGIPSVTVQATHTSIMVLLWLSFLLTSRCAHVCLFTCILHIWCGCWCVYAQAHPIGIILLTSVTEGLWADCPSQMWTVHCSVLLTFQFRSEAGASERGGVHCTARLQLLVPMPSLSHIPCVLFGLPGAPYRQNFTRHIVFHVTESS